MGNKKGINLAEKNGMWKGDNAGLDAIHVWIRTRKPKPKLCVDCRKKPPIDLANISQRYKRELSDWEWLCRKCHMSKDGRLEKFKQKRILKPRNCLYCKKSFQPKASRTKHCSYKCAMDRVRRLKDISCEWCGEEFRQKKLESRFCGRSCANYHYWNNK